MEEMAVQDQNELEKKIYRQEKAQEALDQAMESKHGLKVKRDSGDKGKE